MALEGDALETPYWHIREESANLPDPDVIAAEIAEDLRAALEQFEAIAEDLNGSRSVPLGLRSKQG